MGIEKEVKKVQKELQDTINKKYPEYKKDPKQALKLVNDLLSQISKETGEMSKNMKGVKKNGSKKSAKK